MNNKVKCPSCGNDIEINDALAHQLKEETERIKKAVEEDARKKIQNELVGLTDGLAYKRAVDFLKIISDKSKI